MYRSFFYMRCHFYINNFWVTYCRERIIKMYMGNKSGKIKVLQNY